MNLVDLHTFVRVAELGSFTRAARELGVPKSTVSRRVSRLEDALGLALLNRTGRRVSLTERGERLHARTAGSLRQLRDAEREIMDASEAPAGTLRLTAPHDLGASPWFAELLTTYRARFPAVRVGVELTNRVVDLAEEGVDIAIRPRREGQGDDVSLVARRLAVLDAALFASPAYVAARGAPTRPEQLAEHALVTHSVVNAGGIDLFGPDGRAVSVRVEPSIVANDFNLVGNAIRAGAGIGFMPTFATRDEAERGALVRVLHGWRLAGGAVWLVWPQSRHLAPRVRAFIDHTVEVVESLLG